MLDHTLLSGPSAQVAFETAERSMLGDLLAFSPHDVRLHLGLELLEVAGGVTLQFMTRFPMLGAFNRTLGLGLQRPVTDDDLTLIRAAAHQRGLAQLQVGVLPQTQPADLSERLLALGATPVHSTLQLGRTLEPVQLAIATDLEVRAAGLPQRETFADVLIQGYGMPEEFRPLAQETVGAPNWHNYLAYRGDEAVGCASLALLGDFGWTGNAATLPAHRQTGVQAALIARRVQDAARFGVRRLFTQVDEDLPEVPSPSARNMRRTGFVSVYRRLNYLLPVVSP